MEDDGNRAVLNVCFPYTSRDEITTAIRSTVSDFSQPLQPLHSASKRPFSESSIARNIRSRKLYALPDVPEVSEDSSMEDVAYPPKRTNSPVPSASSTTTTESTIGSAVFSSAATPHGHGSPDSSYPHSPEDGSDALANPSTLSSKTSSYPDPELITARTLTDHMYTAGSPPLDLLIRTSGVQRLSDFMLWQCHEHTSIVFLKCLWPEFDLWQFLPVLVEWQWWRRRDDVVEREVEMNVRSGKRWSLW